MKNHQFAPKPLHDILLQSIHAYYFLTIEQLTRLNYSTNSLTYVREKVKELVDAGFLIRCFVPRATQAGATPSILFLAKRGINYLQVHVTTLPNIGFGHAGTSWPYNDQDLS